MITPDDWDNLLEAIRAIAPNPLVQIALGFAGVLGVVVGFLLSLIKERLDRGRKRREELQGAIADRRKDAVDALGRHAVWWVDSFQVVRAGSWQPAEVAIADSFLATGNPDDELVRSAAQRFFDQLRATLFGYGEFFADEGERYDAFTLDKEEPFRALVSDVRHEAQRWVDRGRDAKEFANYLDKQAERLVGLRRVPTNE